MTEIKPRELPPKSNFIKWYNSVLKLADIADKRYPIKGTFVWLPYGVKLMRNIKEHWDKLFQESGISEILVPLFVSRKNAEANKKWYEGFQKNLYSAVLPTGKSQFILRPTGEPAMYPLFSLWIKDYGLPLRVYETVSSYRYESRTTHTLIRDREITFWYEIHTAHKTKKESEEEAQTHLEIIRKIWKYLSIPPIVVNKPPYEVFPGAVGAIEAYTILPDGRLLENGSINILGQAYSRIYDITYMDEEGKKQYVWQICTGNGARYLAAVIALHGDDRGLCLPPTIAPVQCIIVPIMQKKSKQEVEAECLKLKEKLREAGIRVEIDLRENITPGEKFYQWEIKGVPVRIEMGPREIQKKCLTVFRRDLLTRETVESDKIIEYLNGLMSDIGATLENRVKKLFDSKVKDFDTIEDAFKWVRKGGVAKVSWCGEQPCYERICETEQAIEAIGTLLETEKKHECIVCKKETTNRTLVSKIY
jgi:prolyl-tRNA synthetase